MIEPHDGIIGIGSGGTYALGTSRAASRSSCYTVSHTPCNMRASLFVHALLLSAAARALIDQPNLDAEEIGRKAMQIAADICVYTNHNFVVEVLEENPEKKD